MFAPQDEIARAIVAALRVTLATGGAAAPIVTSATEDTAAYTLYLKGRYHWSQSRRDGLVRAVQYFQQAVARDTRYARAYVGLADANAMLGIRAIRLAAFRT